MLLSHAVAVISQVLGVVIIYYYRPIQCHHQMPQIYCAPVVLCYSNKLVDFAVKYLILKPTYQLI